MRNFKWKSLLTKQSMGAKERNKAMLKELERIAKKAKKEAETAKDALKIIRKHFAEVTTEQFIENVKKYCPELLPDETPRGG